MTKRLNAFAILLFGVFFFALADNITLNNLQHVKVDQLKDAQISEFVRKYTDAGYTLADIEQLAQSKKIALSALPIALAN